MKIAVAFLFSLVLSVVPQRQSYWHSPYAWNPYYASNNAFRPINPYHGVYPTPNRPTPSDIQRADLANFLKAAIFNNQKNDHPESPIIESSLEGRSKFGELFSKKEKEDAPQDRAFGLGFLGLNALANYAINSISFTTTSTTYTTTTSTLTLGTIVTCYTRSLFTSTTPCRRKRKLFPGILAGDEIDQNPFKLEPSDVFAIEPSMGGIDIIMREGKSFADDLKHLIQSSQQEPAHETDEHQVVGDRALRQSPRLFGFGAEVLENLPEETLYVSTSTVTSYSLYTSSVTRTITAGALVASSVLSCLPACFTIC